MIKRCFAVVFALLIALTCSGYKKPYTYKIEAERNAFFHNNVGLNYLQDKYYYAAIQEFKIAISLSPNTQAAAIFYNNLGDVYMTIGYPNYAEDAYLNALKLYGLNLQYYINLTKCYKAMGVLDNKIKTIKINENPYNKILKGLMLVESGDKRNGIIMLDEFCSMEPDLIITAGIKSYIKNLVSQS